MIVFQLKWNSKFNSGAETCSSPRPQTSNLPSEIMHRFHVHGDDYFLAQMKLKVQFRSREMFKSSSSNFKFPSTTIPTINSYPSKNTTTHFQVKKNLNFIHLLVLIQLDQHMEAWPMSPPPPHDHPWDELIHVMSNCHPSLPLPCPFDIAYKLLLLLGLSNRHLRHCSTWRGSFPPHPNGCNFKRAGFFNTTIQTMPHLANFKVPRLLRLVDLTPETKTLN